MGKKVLSHEFYDRISMISWDETELGVIIMTYILRRLASGGGYLV